MRTCHIKCRTLLLSCVLLLFFPWRVFAAYQTPLTFCSNDNDYPAIKEPAAWPDHFVKLTRVGDIFMPNFGSGSTLGDSMTQPYLRDDSGLHSIASGDQWNAKGWDEMWYVPANSNTPGTAPLYRLYSSALQDHMDSTDPNEAPEYGYQAEGPIGYPWASAQSGTTYLARYMGSLFDHRTERPGLSLADRNWAGTLITYTEMLDWNGNSGNPARYAYPRYGRRYSLVNFTAANSSTSGRCAVIRTNPYANSLDDGVLKVDFNREWGNAIGRIYYSPTRTVGTSTTSAMQLVKEYSIGAMVQNVLWAALPGLPNDANYRLNPTEAGSVDPFNLGNSFRWAGSPVLSSSHSGPFNPSNPQPINLSTVLKPLNYNNNVFSYSGYTTDMDTTAVQPLMWRGQFNRTTNVGYADRSGSFHANVLEMVWSAQLDSQVTTTIANEYQSTSMNPTYWFYLHNFGTNGTNSQPATNAATTVQVVTFDLQQGTVQSIMPSDPNSPYRNIQSQSCPPAPDGSVYVPNNVSACPWVVMNTSKIAIIAYRQDESFAVGFLAYPVMAGSIYEYRVRMQCGEGNCGSYQDQAFILSIFDNQSLADKAAHHEDSYAVFGDLPTVENTLQRIYCKQTNTCY